MNSKKVVGKKIKKINQKRRVQPDGERVYDVLSIVLEDNTIIWFNVVEVRGGDYAIDAGSVKVPVAKKKK